MMQYLKRILPFTLTFVVGAGLGGFAGLFKSRTVETGRTTYLSGDFARRGCKGKRERYAHAYPAYDREGEARTNVVATQSFPADSAMFESGSDWRPVVVLSSPDPVYPREARRYRAGGVVRLSVLFGADGKAKVEEVVNALPDGLTEAAKEAARAIVFTPATLGGKPVSTHGVVDCVFEFESGKRF
jgi:TonB family protein